MLSIKFIRYIFFNEEEFFQRSWCFNPSSGNVCSEVMKSLSKKGGACCNENKHLIIYLHKSRSVFRTEWQQQTSVLLSFYNKTLLSAITKPRDEHPSLTVGVKTASELHNSCGKIVF